MVNSILGKVPDYEEDIRRLMKTEKIDFSAAINDLLKSLFNIYIPDEVLSITNIVMWGALICFVGWILYKEFGIFRTNDIITSNTTASTPVTQTEIGTAEDADIRGHNFVQELQKAVTEGDYATAVHLRYLITLQRLDQARRIKWHPTKTPMMYVRELEIGADKLKEITMAFLYIKYGHYPANQEVYEEVTTLSGQIWPDK